MAAIKTLRDYVQYYQLGDAAGAWVASDPDEGDYHRRRGYREAGTLLLREAAGSPAARDHLIYPALFVYRHFYELQLKALTPIAARVLEEEQEAKLVHGQLPALLAHFERAMGVVWPDELDEVRPVREAVDFLHGVDSSSQVFRYSRLSRTNDPSVSAAAFLDPDLVHAFLDEGAVLLEGAYTGMDVWLDQRNEFRAAQYELQQEIKEDFGY